MKYFCLFFMVAICISCFGNSVEPSAHEIIGRWGLAMIDCDDDSFAPIGIYTLIKHVYNPNQTYAVYSGDSVIEEGRYIIQNDNWDAQTLILKPSNQSYLIKIVSDTMWMKRLDANGECASIFLRTRD